MYFSQRNIGLTGTEWMLDEWQSQTAHAHTAHQSLEIDSEPRRRRDSRVAGGLLYAAMATNRQQHNRDDVAPSKHRTLQSAVSCCHS